jgi:hypothetical protein
MVSTWPFGVPSWTLPVKQHDDIPTPVDIMNQEIDLMWCFLVMILERSRVAEWCRADV